MNIRRGDYSANYFIKAKKILRKNNSISEMQFTHFNGNDIKISGVEESVKIIKKMIPFWSRKKIEVYGKRDGDISTAGEAILIIKGPYRKFALVENIVDGILARRSSVTNNCYQLLKIVPPEKIIFMADRTDDYRMQPFDGFSAYIGGIRTFVTKASTKLIKKPNNVKVTGTMPHALIQQHQGDLCASVKAFDKTFGNTNTVALIDYNNDSLNEIEKLSKQFKNLWAVRMDTSISMIDKCFKQSSPEKYGVCPELIFLVRKKLDECGFTQTKIIVSSKLNSSRISELVSENAPVDFYGVGSSLIERNIHFTADLVKLNNICQSKAGRKASYSLQDLKKLKRYI